MHHIALLRYKRVLVCGHEGMPDSGFVENLITFNIFFVIFLPGYRIVGVSPVTNG